MRDKLELLAFDKEAIIIIFLSGAFVGLGALFYELSIKLFLTGFLFGAFLAFAALPYIDSEKWKSKPDACCVLGLIGTVMFAVMLNQPFHNVILFGVVGAILGYFAPVWAKHI